MRKTREEREFIERVFDRASRPMLLHLVKQTKLSDKERKALLRTIEEVENLLNAGNFPRETTPGSLRCRRRERRRWR